MRALVVGATGTLGRAVAFALQEAGHTVLHAASREGSEVQIDISVPSSIRLAFLTHGEVDAVVCCAGVASFGCAVDLDEEGYQLGIRSKLMGQVNLVRLGCDYIADDGVFVLTAGQFSQKPPPNTAAIALCNGAIESFTRAAAHDLPRGIRIGCVSPPFITETAVKMGWPTEGTLPAAEAARHYVLYLEDARSGSVVHFD